MTRTSGRSALTATAMPEISPPPPDGTMSVSHLGRLLEDLEPQRALRRDDVGVVEGVDQDRPGLVGELPRRGERVVEDRALEHDVGAVARVACSFGSGAPSGMKTVD